MMKSNKKFFTLLLLSIFTLSACNNQNEISTSTHSDSSSTSKTDSSETSSNSQDSSSTVDSSEELAKLETVLRKYDDLSNWNFDLLFVCDDENPDYSFTTNYNIDGLNYKLTYSLMDYEFVEYLEILENEMFYYYQDYETGEYIKISSNYEDEFSSVSYLDYFEFGGLSSELFNYQNNKYYVNNDYLNDVGIYIFGYELDYKSISFELTNEEIGKIIASYDDTYNLTSGTYELTLSNHGNASITLPNATEYDESSSGETSNVGTVIFSSTDVSPWTTNATPTGFTANRGVQFTKNGSPSFSFKNTTFAESVNTVSIKLNTNRAEGWIISVTVNGVTYLINGETSYTFTNDDTPSFSDLSVLTFECPETPETGTININFEAVESTTNKSIYINAIGINNPNL